MSSKTSADSVEPEANQEKRCGDRADLVERRGLATRLVKLLRMSARSMGVSLCRRRTVAL
jgi:hypothetical protein